ncbi:MAG: hypothetical protein RRB13_06305 [bacterium]|nr:hypothetical protein [bacterium]
MMRRLPLFLGLFLLLAGPVWAESKVAEVAADHEPAKLTGKNKPILVGPKKVLLVPQSFKQVTSGKDTLTIEYEKLHPTDKYPIVRIQGIQFNVRTQGETIEWTWQGAGYMMVWPKNEAEKVTLMSSEPFDKQAFTPEKKDAKHALIKEGLKVQTKRQDGTVAMLEITAVEEQGGKMTKFSARTFSDEKQADQFQNENNIPAPPVHKQYEKGVNGEVLFIFTSNDKGQIFVYWR